MAAVYEILSPGIADLLLLGGGHLSELIWQPIYRRRPSSNIQHGKCGALGARDPLCQSRSQRVVCSRFSFRLPNLAQCGLFAW